MIWQKSIYQGNYGSWWYQQVFPLLVVLYQNNNLFAKLTSPCQRTCLGNVCVHSSQVHPEWSPRAWSSSAPAHAVEGEFSSSLELCLFPLSLTLWVREVMWLYWLTKTRIMLLQKKMNIVVFSAQVCGCFNCLSGLIHVWPVEHSLKSCSAGIWNRSCLEIWWIRTEILKKNMSYSS